MSPDIHSMDGLVLDQMTIKIVRDDRIIQKAGSDVDEGRPHAKLLERMRHLKVWVPRFLVRDELSKNA